MESMQPSADNAAGALVADDGVGPATPWARAVGLARAARPRQWIKNFACFAGLLFSGKLFVWSAIEAAGLAFVGFCLAASGIYLINDVIDRPLDRQHPGKRSRPIASGLVPASWAIVAALGLMAAALASSLALPPPCRLVLAAYIAMTVAYSVRLKHTVLLDVLVIALGFVLRVMYGVYAIDRQPTSYIVLCMFFLALFLGYAKRRGELNLLGDGEAHRRPVLRKYSVAYLDQQLNMTAAMAILCYAFYTVTGRPGNASLVLTVPLVYYGISRYLIQVKVHGSGDTPERQVIGDPISLAIVFAWAALCILIIYGDIHVFFEK